MRRRRTIVSAIVATPVSRDICGELVATHDVPANNVMMNHFTTYAGGGERG